MFDSLKKNTIQNQCNTNRRNINVNLFEQELPERRHNSPTMGIAANSCSKDTVYFNVLHVHACVLMLMTYIEEFRTSLGTSYLLIVLILNVNVKVTR